MYTSIYELPTQVTSALSEDDAKVWMNEFNKAFAEEEAHTPESILKHRERAWRACKDLPSSFSFCIVASVEDIDRDREVLDLDSIKKKMDDFISYGGNVNYDHSNYNVGTIWAWNPITKDGMPGIEVWGNVFGGDPIYDQTRKLFTKGVNSLSVAGAGDKGRFICDDKGCYTKRGVKQLMEISLCKVPANRHATLKWYNESANLTKSDSDLTLSVEEYTLHRDESSCPILSLRKSLRDVGFDAHARSDGVHIAMSVEDFDRMYGVMKSAGLEPVWDGAGALLNTREAVLERIFKTGYSEGWVGIDGSISPNISEDDFKDLYASGFLKSQNGGYYLAE